LASKRTGKKQQQLLVSGEVQLQFTLYDASNVTASPQQILQKLGGIIASSPGLGEEDDGLERAESGDADEDDDLDATESPEDPGDPKNVERKRKRLRVARLKKKATDRAYELNGSADVAGVLFLEVTKITDLPPERNG